MYVHILLHCFNDNESWIYNDSKHIQRNKYTHLSFYLAPVKLHTHTHTFISQCAHQLEFVYIHCTHTCRPQQRRNRALLRDKRVPHSSLILSTTQYKWTRNRRPFKTKQYCLYMYARLVSPATRPRERERERESQLQVYTWELQLQWL